MKRGSLYWINLGTSHPPELGDIWPLRVELPDALDRQSFAVIPGMRQVSKSRLTDLVTNVPDETMRRIDDALAAYLSD